MESPRASSPSSDARRSRSPRIPNPTRPKPGKLTLAKFPEFRPDPTRSNAVSGFCAWMRVHAGWEKKLARKRKQDRPDREWMTDLSQLLEGDGSVSVAGLRDAARGLFAASLARGFPERPLLIVVPTSKEGDLLSEDLAQFAGWAGPGGIDPHSPLRVFPRHDTAPYDRFSPQNFVTASRMEVLYRLSVARESRLAGESRREPAPVVIAPFTALLARVPSAEALRERTHSLSVGETRERDELLSDLVSAGYTRQPAVEEAGEFAVRGGIVDVFPPQRSKPLRIEFFGDEVDSIRDMDPASQRSGESLRQAVVPPARELLFDRDLIVARGDAIRELARSLEVPDRQADECIDSLLRGHVPPGGEALASLLQPSLGSFFDYLPSETVVLWDNETRTAEHAGEYCAEILENYDAARVAHRLVAEPDALFLREEEALAALEERQPITLERLGLSNDRRTSLELRSGSHEELSSALKLARQSERALQPLVDAAARWESRGLRVALCASSLSGASRLAKLLAPYGLDLEVERGSVPVADWAPGGLELRVAKLSSGFSLADAGLVVVTEEEIFGPRARRRQKREQKNLGDQPELENLATDDLLVHAEHGIGVYRGLVPLELGAIRGEFLRLEYEGGDRLFLPVHRLSLIQRYVGADGQRPKIDRLGGVTWEKTKRQVKKSVLILAKDLVGVQAQRELAEGFAFGAKDKLQEAFDAGFPYEETPDQSAAIDDTLGDMAMRRPMDRLVCGDVGYGKTEVAIRAAFRAVMDGKQVALLVPTTILCQQHMETFRARFEGYPIEVDSLSRFRSAKESKGVLEGMIGGKIDVVVGTHRLLQKDIAFRDLGLLIVDEEHRFGVTHKERIKKMRASVDVLTLTATPIPRTLQMAFTGLRDLSVINTPPPDRLAIRTQVARFDPSLIREAILREVRRGGQVFFVHNRVNSIDAIGSFLERTVPEVRILIAHGQMRERQLEEQMLRFARGEADLLLCTTIVESGLDLPNANTMLIDRADAMGLAQLYQLRGRIGRSGRRAYAYLLVPGEDALTEDATRRLEAIRDLSELGSGFRLANLDLEIRGAGNLLGPEQSGNLGAVGYDTYMGLLEEAVEELRGGHVEVEIDPEIRLPVSAQLPESYVADVNQRLVLYKRLASAIDDEAVDELRDELLDRYGPLPEDTLNLERVLRLKLKARRAGVACVDWARGELILSVDDRGRVDPGRLMKRLKNPEDPLHMDRDQRLRERVAAEPGPELFSAAHTLLDSLLSEAPSAEEALQ